MNVLLTGANGYIGKRLLPVLLKEGHTVYACVRNKKTAHFNFSQSSRFKIIEIDFLEVSTNKLPLEIDVAYFLMHSLSSEEQKIEKEEQLIAHNFNKLINQTNAKQTIYLGGISNDTNLSKHLKSRRLTEEILKQSNTDLTVLRAAIIIGSGGASFEIIRDLVEKLPVMIAPKWLLTKCQPIAVKNVIDYLVLSIDNEKVKNKTFDIGGPEILTYKSMLLQFAKVRKIRRLILTLPVLSPKISSYWLYFVTSTNFKLASNLVNSMKNEVIIKQKGIQKALPIPLISYQDAIKMAFKRIEQNMVVSSWVDSESSGLTKDIVNNLIQIPQHGVFKDVQTIEFQPELKNAVIDRVWKIGGENGWYYGDWLWRIRGFLDKMAGGVGLRRGRRSPTEIYKGDSLDFWRVLLADKSNGRLLLFAEMKLPGDAWLEFKILSNEDDKLKLVQSAIFRPRGLLGRLYWYSVAPFHLLIFKNMAKKVALG